MINPTLSRVTQRITHRSQASRAAYLARIEAARSQTVHRAQLACGNLAHGFAACQPDDKTALKNMVRSDIAIITAYNDMLSAHQPYEHYPQRLKQALQAVGAVGQVAGGVPAMCDGVTQGQAGHGAVAGQPRRDRHVGRRRPVAQHVRRRAVPRHLRQDRAGPADGRAVLRPPARAVRAGRPDDQRLLQQGKGARAPAVRRGQGRPPGAAGSRGRVLSRHPAPAPSTAPPTPTRC